MSDYKTNLMRHQEKQQKKKKTTVEVPKASKQAKIFQCVEFQYICGYRFNLKYHMAQMH